MSDSKNTPAVSKRENIQVFVRVRPMNEKERLEKKNQNIVDLKRDREVVVRDRTNAAMTKTFTFDRAFGPLSKQIDVYKSVAQPMIAEVLAGYNCTIFAYGQTGTGKTFTMEGERTPGDGNSWDKDPLCGLVPRVLSHIFDELRVKNMEFTMAVTYLELYNEELIDLLSPEEDNSKLRLFEDAANKGSVIVQGLTDVRVLDKKQVYDILNQGSKKRQTAATYMNATSSRSHTIFTVTVHIRESTEAGEDLIRTGKINLVDLAGSENISRSGATNQRAKEAGNINQSLLTLGRVITALVEKTPHIPYRESKLTRLLQDSLGGKTKTCIVATVSPVLANLEESMSTLDYAHRAKSITNRPQINQRLSKQAFIKEYDQEIERLRKDLIAQRSGHGIYVDPDNYNEMNIKLERQDMEILEKIQQIRTLEDEKERREAFINALSEQLEQKTQILEETTLNLQVTERDRDDKEVLLQHHQVTEANLKHETHKLIEVTDTVVDDLDKVHEALSRKRILEEVNKKAARGFSASIANILHRANDESKYMQEKQSEQMESTVKQLEATRQLHAQALDVMLTQVQDFSAFASSGAKKALDNQQKQHTEMVVMEKEHLESFKTSLAAQKEQLLISVEAQKKQLMLHKQLEQQLEATMVENTRQIGELVTQKFEDLTSSVQKLKDNFSASITQLQEKNDALIEQLNLGRAKNFDQEGKHSLSVITDNQLMDKMQQLLENVNTQFQEIRKHKQDVCISTADFLRCATNDWDESSGLAVNTSSQLTTSNLTSNSMCEELVSQLNTNRADICTLPQQQTQKVKQILHEVQKVDEDMTTCIHDCVEAMTQNFSASENLYQINLDDRTNVANEHALSQKSVMEAMALQLEEFKHHATEENVTKKREGDTQVALTRQALEKAKQAAGQWGDVVDTQMHNLQSQVCHFVEVELKDYVPTGVTPAKTNREYPRDLKFTSPAACILARHHAELDRVKNGGDSGMNSPVNSSHSSASDVENHVEEPPVIPVIVKERQHQAQRRILGARND